MNQIIIKAKKQFYLKGIGVILIVLIGSYFFREDPIIIFFAIPLFLFVLTWGIFALCKANVALVLNENGVYSYGRFIISWDNISSVQIHSILEDQENQEKINKAITKGAVATSVIGSALSSSSGAIAGAIGGGIGAFNESASKAALWIIPKNIEDLFKGKPFFYRQIMKLNMAFSKNAPICLNLNGLEGSINDIAKAFEQFGIKPILPTAATASATASTTKSA